MGASEPITVRRARPSDLSVIVEYNRALARETESKELDLDVLTAGVQAVLDDSSRGFYLVAALGTGQGAPVVGQLMITYEWSDWRNGLIWWFQSVYVQSEQRRRGVFGALYREILRRAELDPDVVGLRLYVEEHNERARETYERLGMIEPGYRVMERLSAPAPRPETREDPDPGGRRG